jgi:CRP-like cAMP-binding protein
MATDIEIFNKLLSLAKCFKGFGPNDVRDLLNISSKAIWRAGEHAFIEGDQDRDMYVICSGKMNVWRKSGGEKVGLARLSEGESFGELGLILSEGRSACATALEDTVAIRIHYERLHQAPSVTSLLYKNIAKDLAEKLKIANNIIVFQTQMGAEHPHLETIGVRRRPK